MTIHHVTLNEIEVNVWVSTVSDSRWKNKGYLTEKDMLDLHFFLRAAPEICLE